MSHTYGRHGDECPPVRIQHVGEGGAGIVVLEDVGQRGEDEDAHCQEKHEEAQLLVTVLQGEAQTLETNRVPSKFENSVKRKTFPLIRRL